jgi:hypothetical protein
MGQVLHGCATTTEAVRRAIQNSQKSLRALAAHYGINQKTVPKWRKRSSVADLPTGLVHRAFDRGRSDCCPLSPAHALAPRRLPLCPAGNAATSHPVGAASLPAAPLLCPLQRYQSVSHSPAA